MTKPFDFSLRGDLARLWREAPKEGLARMLHIGRKVPKYLAKDGWTEAPGAIHMGRGIWMMVLVKAACLASQKPASAPSAGSADSLDAEPGAGLALRVALRESTP